MAFPRVNKIVRNIVSQPLFVPVLLGLLVLGVLVQGSVNRGAPDAQTAPEPAEPQDGPLVAIRSGLDKAPLEYFSEYWFQLGDDVRRVLVEIGPSHTPGVIVAPGVAVSSIAAADELRSLTASRELWRPSPPAAQIETAEEPVDRVLLADSTLGLALFRSRDLQPATPLVPVDSGLSYPGSLVAAVSLAANGRLRIAPGHLESPPAESSEAVFAPLEATINMPFLRGAAAVVDLDSELLGVAIKGPAGPRMIAWPAIRGLLKRLESGEPCRAVEVSNLDAAAVKMLNLSAGVLIEKVYAAAYESAPPFRPGDILLEWAGQPIADAQAFRALYDAAKPGSHIAIVVWRDGRRIRGEMIAPGADCRPAEHPPQYFAGLGFTARWTSAAEAGAAPPGWQVLAVRPDSRADAVLKIGDRLVSVNGRNLQGPASVRSLQRYDAAEDVLLGVWRRDRVVMLIPPAPEAIHP
jgi:S1-C subfamily serine protease